MAASTYHRVFKHIMDDAPLTYIKKRRLLRAKALLIEKQLAVSQVYSLVGYQSFSQFSREFKRYFGVSPSHVNQLGYREFV